MKSDELFIDEVTLSVASGDGGNGCVSLHREKFVPRGGPDGGDGGRGADVTIRADRNLATLLDQRMRRVIRAENGAAGQRRNRNGRDGRDLEIRVPVGTLVYDEDDEGGAALADLAKDGDHFVVCRGGRGGRGNTRFKTSTRQTPDFAEDGREGQRRRLRLSLKLLADVGLVGFPNAGKSTLLRSLSAARPRVANYPFTTLTPSLGVCEVGDRRFVAADIPGLIEGAHEGAGLGHRFLRHVERTRVLVHLLDAGPDPALEDGADPTEALLERYAAIRRELAEYDASLAERPEIVALDKIDLLPDREVLAPVEAELARQGHEVVRVSGATGEGVDALKRRLLALVDADLTPDAETA